MSATRFLHGWPLVSTIILLAAAGRVAEGRSDALYNLIAGALGLLVIAAVVRFVYRLIVGAA